MPVGLEFLLCTTTDIAELEFEIERASTVMTTW
jgi:hypothetical protein